MIPIKLKMALIHQIEPNFRLITFRNHWKWNSLGQDQTSLRVVLKDEESVEDLEVSEVDSLICLL